MDLIRLYLKQPQRGVKTELGVLRPVRNQSCKEKFFVAIQSLAISIGTSGYGLEHLATPFKGKLLNSVFRTKPNQSSGLAGPTVQRAAPPKRRLPGYADDRS